MLFEELRNEMHKHEPSCLLYSLLKSRKSSSDYIVHEQYVDQAALDFHSQSVTAWSVKHFKIPRPDFAARGG